MMKKLPRELLMIFLVCFFVGVATIATVCTKYTSFGFDGQNILTWDYEAFSHLIPYRDVGYYYGVLSYYKNDVVIAFLVYALIAPSLFTGFFLAFQSMFRQKVFAYLALILLVIFVVVFTGMDSFSRYGIGVFFSVAWALILHRRKDVMKYAAVGGVVSAAMFSLVTDQGVFVVTMVVLLSIIDLLLSSGSIGARLRTMTKQLLVFFLAFAAGLLPFVLYLLSSRSLAPFLRFMYQLSLLTTFAKAPFLPFATSASNLFTFSALGIAVFVIAYRCYFDRAALRSIRSYVEIAIVLSLILLEQKSFIRSIDATITFAAFILWITLLSEFVEKLKKPRLIFAVILFALPLVFRLPIQPNLSVANAKEHFGQSLEMLIMPQAIEMCRAQSFEPSSLALPNGYLKLVSQFEQPDLRGQHFFSFPGDPIFYVLLHQQPPLYFTAYEASSQTAQREQIAYMERMQVNYVIYNLQNTEMDGVPQLVRDLTLSQYIFTHFAPVESVDQFVVLRRVPNVDLFSDNLSRTPLQTQLLHADLGNIPQAEGKKPRAGLNVLHEGSIDEINTYLAQHKTPTDNLYIAITSQTPETNTTLTLTTDQDLQSVVTFRSCTNFQPCILHLTNLPLFYRNRTLAKLSADSSVHIQLLSVLENTTLW